MKIEITHGKDGVYLTFVHVLTPSEKARVESKELESRVRGLAKDLHIHIGMRKNNASDLLTVTKYYPCVVEELHIREAEKAAITFLEELRKMEIPTPEDLEKKLIEYWEFVKNTMLNIDNANANEIEKALDITTNIAVTLTMASILELDEVDEPEPKTPTAEKE